MKILVTGGMGFIGSHTVVELHNAGYSPIIVDNLSNSESAVLSGLKQITGVDFPFYQIDCRDAEALAEVFKENAIDGVVHFAASKAVGESVEKPLLYYQNNIDSTLTLLSVMADYRCSNFIFSSSCTVYGQPDALPVTEQTPKKPAESPYGNTKQICEEILEDVIRAKQDLKGIALRYFNPIGAHPSGLIGELPLGVPNNLVPFITQSAAGIRGPLTVFGNDYNTPDGTCIRDYIHVVDLAKAHVASLEYIFKNESPAFELFNIGTGKGSTVLEVINSFENSTGQKLEYHIGARRSGDVEKVYASVDKANQSLDWHAEYKLDDCMIHAWQWQLNLMDKARG